MKYLHHHSFVKQGTCLIFIKALRLLTNQRVRKVSIAFHFSLINPHNLLTHDQNPRHLDTSHNSTGVHRQTRKLRHPARLFQLEISCSMSAETEDRKKLWVSSIISFPFTKIKARTQNVRTDRKSVSAVIILAEWMSISWHVHLGQHGSCKLVKQVPISQSFFALN